MTHPIASRATAFVLALLITVATFGGIDQLASAPDVSPQWAQAIAGSRG